MYISWYKRLRFFADISKKLKKKYTILDNLRTITQEGDMKTIHMTPFSHTFEYSGQQNS